MPTEVRTTHKPASLDPAGWLADDTFAVYLFHGVVDQHDAPVRNYTRKHINTRTFSRVLNSLTEAGTPVSMDQIIEHHNNRESFPAKAFAITFDDGFENNYSVAAGVLQEFGIPATFYVTTDFVDRNMMSWIDRVEHCFDRTQSACIRLPWSDKPHYFCSSQEKIAVLDLIRANAKTDPAVDVDELAAKVCRQCGQQEIKDSDGPLDRKMSWAQVRDLAGNDLFTIGGHSHTHRTLAFLDQDELTEEIHRSLHLLKYQAGVQARHYSYPEGLRHSYSETVIEMLKQCAIECCPTAEPGVNSIDDDLFRLRRIPITG